MLIRNVKNEDLKAILEIEKECFLIKPYTLEQLNYELKENQLSKFICAELNNEIVGFLIYWVTFDSATIVQIAIKEGFRKQGLASLLIKESEKDFKDLGVEFYTLEVRESNLAAIKLYEKSGFSRITVKKQYYEDGENAIYMMKGEI